MSDEPEPNRPDNSQTKTFGHWTFDAATGDLFDGEATIRLEPQVALLLNFFLENQNRLISRDELMTEVWNQRIVSDHAINRCISILRSTLSPNERNDCIETVVRRGFISHFPPADSVVDSKSESQSQSQSIDPSLPKPQPEAQTWPNVERRRLNLWRPLALAVLLVLMVVFTLPRLFDRPSANGLADTYETPLIAILPFISNDQSGESEFFASGMHDDLLTQVAQLQSLRVISRTSVSEYRGREMNMREIGQQLGADAILEGGVQRIGDQIRINMQLIDAKTDAHLWAEQYDRELTPTNIFEIQSEIARSVASAMQSTLSSQDVGQLNTIPTDNMAAYRAFHEAMQIREEVTILAPAYIAALERAVSLDENFTRAWVELAGSLSFKNFRNRDAESLQRLENILERIHSLEPNNYGYLVAQSYYTYYVLKDYDRAFELIAQALLLAPSDLQMLELRTWIQRRQGDFEGIVNTLRKISRLDPRNEYWIARQVSALRVVHRYDEAIDVIEGAPVSSFRLAVHHSVLRTKDHRDPSRLLTEIESLEREYGVSARPLTHWEAYIAARDFDGAMAFIDTVEASGLPAQNWESVWIPSISLSRIITAWFQQPDALKSAELAVIKQRLESDAASELDGLGSSTHLAMAILTAAEGNRDETTRLIRTWFREAPIDQAEFVNHRHYACRALGMAGAASAVVECLQSGFQSPSLLMPFIEPYLPYYDSVREDASFIELLDELETNQVPTSKR